MDYISVCTEQNLFWQFHASIEGKLPQYNTRIKLPMTQRDLVYGDGKYTSLQDSSQNILNSHIYLCQKATMQLQMKRCITKNKLGGATIKIMSQYWFWYWWWFFIECNDSRTTTYVNILTFVFFYKHLNLIVF